MCDFVYCFICTYHVNITVPGSPSFVINIHTFVLLLVFQIGLAYQMAHKTSPVQMIICQEA